MSSLIDIQKTTVIFLMIELLDYLTTYIGLSMGHQELNPLMSMIGLGNLLAIKLLVVFTAFLYLQLLVAPCKKEHLRKKLQWLLIIVPGLFVAWNFVMLIFGNIK